MFKRLIQSIKYYFDPVRGFSSFEAEQRRKEYLEIQKQNSYEESLIAINKWKNKHEEQKK